MQKNKEQNDSDGLNGHSNYFKKENVLSLGFLTAVLVPALMIFLSFSFDHWGWGLMDDFHILESGTGFWDRLNNYAPGLISFGLFRPVYALHSAIFYTIFQDNPLGFYFFRLFEVLMVTGIWGFLSYRLTNRKLSFFIVPAITLSFHYFYDSIFYLSSQEILGLFFLGLSLVFFMNVFFIKKVINYSINFFLGLIFLLLAFWCKEPFLSAGIAVGLTFLCLSFKYRKTGHFKVFFLIGILVIICSGVQAFFVMKFIKGAYSSNYNPANITSIIHNFMSWAKKDLLNHMPWILAAFFIIFFKAANNIKSGDPDRQKAMESGLVLGLFLYLGYLLILLPWNTNSYYATPLGLFFAFFVASLITGPLIKIEGKTAILIVLGSIVLNIIVCQYALTRESRYQNNTYQFMEWVKDNKANYQLNDNVLCNAMEAGDTIPKYINKKWGLGLNTFRWSLDPFYHKDDKEYAFYLYSPRFGGLKKKIFNGWETLFLSDNWILYHRISQ